MKTTSTIRTGMLALTLFVCCAAYAGAGEKIDKSQAKLIKDRVAAALDMAAYAKLGVSEMFLSTGKWPNTTEEANFTPVIDTNFTIAVGKNGVVTITYHEPAGLAGKTLVLTPSKTDNATVNWACKSAEIIAEYLPKNCR